MSATELAWRLNVTTPYVRRLLRSHTLRPVCVVRRERFVRRMTAERFCKKRRARATKALRELERISQEWGLYRRG